MSFKIAFPQIYSKSLFLPFSQSPLKARVVHVNTEKLQAENEFGQEFSPIVNTNQLTN